MDIIKFVPFHKKENSANKKRSVERISRRFSRKNSFLPKKLLDNIRKICPKTAFPDDCPSFKNFWCYNKDKASFSLVNKNKRKAGIK